MCEFVGITYMNEKSITVFSLVFRQICAILKQLFQYICGSKGATLYVYMSVTFKDFCVIQDVPGCYFMGNF